MSTKIEIPLSKSKLLLLALGALAFVIAGILFIYRPDILLTTFWNNETSLRIIGIVSVLFFGACLIFILRKLFDDKIGLMIDDQGVTDHSSGTSVGLVEWPDITHVKTVQIATTKILLIMVKQPEKYIERMKNGIMKRAMKSNYHLYGSPISITSTSLKIKHMDLEKLIREELSKRKKSVSN